MFKILFPSVPYTLEKGVDEDYRTEANVCKLLGIEYYTFDYDTFTDNGEICHNINFDDTCTVIYRGWMIKPEQYSKLYNFISWKSEGKIYLINSSIQYKNCHCFPNVYPFLSEYTPEIIELITWEDVIKKEITFDFFIKDYVKSTKNQFGEVKKLSKHISREELLDEISTFIKDRDKLFTGNIVLKEFVDLKRIDEKTNEWRVFYFNGEFLTYFQNSYLKTNEHPHLRMIRDVGSLIAHRSNFFTVDFALTENNDWIVIETGDGQVSGLAKGKELLFYNTIFNKTYKTKIYHNQQLINEVNEMFTRIKCHLFELNDLKTSDHPIGKRYPKPSVKELDDVMSRVIFELQKDSDPMIKHIIN
jgi:hypothetical protein